jgi:lipoprotein-anchoring transpeptidase ErfK/SrfK
MTAGPGEGEVGERSSSVPRAVVRHAVVAVVVMVGAGACAFEPRGDRTEAPPSSAADAPTGANASPGPGQGGGTAEPVAGAPSPPLASPKPPSPKPSTNAKPPDTGGCPQGDRQREVETYLARLGGFGTVTVDGRQSPADCTAIKKFQQRYGISPAEGKAGPTTADVARRLADTRTGQCPTGTGTTICINLTLQTVWVIRDGSVVMSPTVTRTGMSGYATPAGTFTIIRKNIKEWSNPYNVWLPYWQQFYGGMGFHETTTYIHDMSIGSHGCVNLLHADAVKLWGLAGVGTRVSSFGRRSGT